MVGKPNLSADSELHASSSHQGRKARKATSSLLDDERTASMADEGGASGAVMESEEPEAASPLASRFPGAPSARSTAGPTTGSFAPPRLAWVAGGFAAGLAGVLLYRYVKGRARPALQPE